MTDDERRLLEMLAGSADGTTDALLVAKMTDDERRLLEMLAGSTDGTTDALLVANGFDFDLIVCLVLERLATATPERVFAGGKPVEVTRVRITDAGRQALADQGRGDKVFL